MTIELAIFALEALAEESFEQLVAVLAGGQARVVVHNERVRHFYAWRHPALLLALCARFASGGCAVVRGGGLRRLRRRRRLLLRRRASSSRCASPGHSSRGSRLLGEQAARSTRVEEQGARCRLGTGGPLVSAGLR